MSIQKVRNTAAIYVAIILALFHIYTLAFGALPGYQQRVVHITGVFLFILLKFPLFKKRLSYTSLFIDGCFMAGMAGVGYYTFTEYETMWMRAGMPKTIDLVYGGFLTLMVIEAARRVTGWALPIISILAIGYAVFGKYMGGIFAHGGYEATRIVEVLFLGTSGIFSEPLGVAATVVAAFVIFGGFLEASGAGKFFIDVSYASLSIFRGGPAKVSVVASSLFGSISGSAVANVSATGTFTIPLMKRTGFTPAFAGAVEATASSGGQIMPPVMGAAAFLMAEMLGVPYTDIIISALIPAILFYIAVYVMVDLKAARLGLKGIPQSELPNPWTIFKSGWYMIIPLLILIFMLVGKGYTPERSAFWSLVIIVAIMLLRSPQKFLSHTVTALRKGIEAMPQVTVATSSAGILVGILTLTGLAFRMSDILIDLSGGNVFVLLIVTMLASLLIGMGMPTVPAYILLATLIAPALIKGGIEPLAAHFFIFYYGVLAGVTPPVALAAFAGAAISGASTWRTSVEAFRLSLAGFLLPYLFVAYPALLGLGNWSTILLALIPAVMGVIFLGTAVSGYWRSLLSIWQRIILLTAAMLLLIPGWITDLSGLALGIAMLLLQYKLPYFDRVKLLQHHKDLEDHGA
jgi:TRAP transporter 4TM/12TM fusion protein